MPGILGYVIPVIDLFAGPGGLGEGFSALRDEAGQPLFKVALSIEKDPVAHKTLLLRSFFRQFDEVPDEYYGHVRGEMSADDLFAKFPVQFVQAKEEAVCAELGKHDWDDIDNRIRRAIGNARTWVLIGGPPCQAYSLAGRSRMRKKNPQKFGKDKRHLLYREYLRILAVHRPPIFVIENVKGLLSSKHKREPIIQRILTDLQSPNVALPTLVLDPQDQSATYRVHSLANTNRKSAAGRECSSTPEDFVLRFEEHGIPQARHRLIIVGIRSDITAELSTLATQKMVPMWRAIQDLPAMRSRLSGEVDSSEKWLHAIKSISEDFGLADDKTLCDYIQKKATGIKRRRNTGGEFLEWKRKVGWQSEWFHDPRLGGVLNHSARGHISADLRRYFFAACYAKFLRRSPKIADFPAKLLPEHRNVQLGDSEEIIFADRFRVQVAHRPATTITSHISKDGHYFIHPDPTQARSLSVREAARIQTFPDNYYFSGPRTEQYRQVGNAVPPLIAREIARKIAAVFR